MMKDIANIALVGIVLFYLMILTIENSNRIRIEFPYKYTPEELHDDSNIIYRYVKWDKWNKRIVKFKTDELVIPVMRIVKCNDGKIDTFYRYKQPMNYIIF